MLLRIPSQVRSAQIMKQSSYLSATQCFLEGRETIENKNKVCISGVKSQIECETHILDESFWQHRQVIATCLKTTFSVNFFHLKLSIYSVDWLINRMISALRLIPQQWYHGMHGSASWSSMTYFEVFVECSDALQRFKLNDHLTWIKNYKKHGMHSHWNDEGHHRNTLMVLTCWSVYIAPMLQKHRSHFSSAIGKYIAIAVCIYNSIYNWSLFNKRNYLSVYDAWQIFKKHQRTSMKSQWEAHAGLQGLGFPTWVVAGSYR